MWTMPGRMTTVKGNYEAIEAVEAACELLMILTYPSASKSELD